jgi:hypothetical protein
LCVSSILQSAAKARPIKSRAGIGLAPRRYIAMTTNTLAGDAWIRCQQLAGQVDQRRILGVGVRQVIRALQLDAKGKVIARLTPFERRDTGMPGPVDARDKLRHRAVALNQKMRRYPQVGNPFKVGMFRDIQAILEKLLHLAGGKLRRWQADVMHHQQRDFAGRALVEVGRRAMTDALAPTAEGVQLHTGSLSVTKCDQYAAFSPVVAMVCRD